MAKSGIGMLLGQFGIDPEEILAVVNDFKENAPKLIAGFSERINRIENGMASMDRKLDMILQRLSEEEINQRSILALDSGDKSDGGSGQPN